MSVVLCSRAKGSDENADAGAEAGRYEGDRDQHHAALDSMQTPLQSRIAGTIRGMEMAAELTTDEKAELALKLWEFLATALVEKGVLTLTEATLPLTKADLEDWDNRALKARTEAILRRMHGLPDEDEGDDQP